MDPLNNRTALLTGASRGIGVHIAQALARAGMKLVLVARSQPQLEQVAADLRARGTEVATIPCDLSELDTLDAMADAAERAYGTVDVLINNAGVEHFGRFQEHDVNVIQQTLRLNLEAPILLSRRLLPKMLARGEGHIVQIASLAGLAGSPYGEVYSATKHGLVGFARSLHASRIADGHNVGSSVVCPGFVSDTGMYAEMQKHAGVSAYGRFRPSKPDDVARAVVDAIKRQQFEVYVNAAPLRPLLALAYLLPAFPEWYGKRSGVLSLLKRVADSRQ